MVKTKIIIVEGVTGSGKSSIAQFLDLQLKKQNIDRIWYHEMDPKNPVGRPFVSAGTKEIIDEIFGKWQTFIESHKNSNKTVILDGRFLSLIMTKMINYNLSSEQIIMYYKKIFAQLSKLDPILIFLNPKDVRKRISLTYKIRKAGEKVFIEERNRNMDNWNRKNLSGLEGFLTFWEEVQENMFDIYQLWDAQKIQLDTDSNDWEHIHQDLCRFLSIDFVDDQINNPQILGKYKYVEENNNIHFEIISEKDNYKLLGFPFFKFTQELQDKSLIYSQKNEYYVQGLPFKLVFLENEEKQIDSFKLITTSTGEEFTKTVFQKV